MSVAYGSLGCVIEWCLLSLAGPWGTNRPGVPASIRPRGIFGHGGSWFGAGHLRRKTISAKE